MIFAAEIRSAVSEEECQRLATLAEGKIVVEIGSEFGRSTVALASTAERVYAIDWHQGDAGSGFKDSLPEFLANLRQYDVRDKVVPIVGRSEDVLFMLAHGFADVAFIDGAHDAESVGTDLVLASKAVGPYKPLDLYGTIVLHDGDQPQVRAAADRYCRKEGGFVRRRVGTLLEIVFDPEDV